MNTLPMPGIRRLLLFVVVLCCLLPLRGLSQSPDVVRYVGNMGVVVSLNGTTTLIDGLHLKYDDDYLNPPASLLDSICHGIPPYRIDVVLCTHVHRDHFHPEPTIRFLLNNPNAKFIAPKQVLDTLMAYPRAKQCQSQWIEAQNMTSVDVSGVRVTPYLLPHTWKARHFKIQNYAYLVQKNTKVFAHFGDSSSEDAADFQNPIFTQILAHTTLDVAIIPSWFLGKSSIVLTIQHLRSKKFIVGHLNPQEARYDHIQPSPVPTELMTKIGQTIRY